MSRRKIISTRRELTLEARGKRKDLGEPLAGSGVVTNCCRELGEGERVPGRLPDDSVPADGASSRRESRHHRPRVAIAQRLQRQLVETGRIERRVCSLAQPNHHRERIGAEAPGDERQRIGGWAVEPLDVISDDQDRRVGGGIGEQRERGERDQE